ncbi:ExbD/TolR family protein [Spiribacter halobius]|uniref:Biopolymer transporter ExbD n=1 Tax=Sediminicurvatus halobius TaxID=2182432 RepID=A0A2U2N212_9GAMM|nr:biopolymer transporter ExbD [Spiribacter halobius]PWG63275.1 biopolymer transporter ExbD [Spiribacter halobius]UEX76651.1 biopolymer transporter ExbD [Spiribacter halobius]
MIGHLRTAPPRRRQDSGLLPLINVVFLLLVFVMLAGQLAPQDVSGIRPPASSQGTPPVSEAVEVTLAANGRLQLAGEPVTADTLSDRLAARLEAQSTLRVRLRADARVDSQRIVSLLDVVRAAGARELELMTVPRP